MAPKSSQRTSLGSSQPQPFEATVTKLCTVIDNAKGKTGEIKAQILVSKLREFLKEFRAAGKELGADYISLIVACLENGEDGICSRLSPDMICVIAELVLQTEACLESERCLFLLAKSLFQDAHTAGGLEGAKSLEIRKRDIGELCREQLLTYFVDDRTVSTMRRWAGVLCIELFLNCKKNCEWIEICPEELRRSIGRQVVNEPDEILRIIYAQLLRTLLETDISVETLFPVDFDEVFYANFPPSTQGSTGWGGSFQTYVDNLFEKGLIESPTIGQLFFATSIGMRPEHSFGVQGHTLYVFVYKSNNSHEISIMAPAKSGVFHQILDIPLRSIRDLTIVTDEYSQVASQIGLELSNGKGHEFFLDSENIELSSVYLTFQPGHVEHFKEELVGRCPGLKVAQADKEAATKPNSSNSQNHRFQVSVSDVIMSRDPNEEQDGEQPSSIISEGPRLRKNSVRETQAEQDETQRSIDMGDKLQDSVDGLKVPKGESNAAAPQITKELSKATPSSNALDFKAPMAPKLKVKPKAKPPIDPRALRNKPVQASTQVPANIAQLRTRGKQEQNNSTTTSQGKSAIQGVRGKQKQSEQTVNTQSETASHVNRVSATSQPRLPPPNRKTYGKTRSIQYTQVTDDIEDWKIPEVPKSRSNGTQKAAANITKSSKGIDSPGYQQFSDDYITEVDERDASTPKVTVAESQGRNKMSAVSKTNVHAKAKKLAELSGAMSQKQKRYSLHAPAKSIPMSGDTFDIPPDPKEDENSQNTKGKKSRKAGKSEPRTAALAKPAIDTKSKEATKKRQSAPAALTRSAGTRNSQRAAAAKANEQLRGADKSDVEDAEVDEQPAPVKSQTRQKGKMKARQAATKVASEVQVDELAPATEVDLEMLRLPLPEIPPPSPVRNETIDHVAVDSSYDTTPGLLPGKLAFQKPQEITVKDSKGSARVSKYPEKDNLKKKETDSALDMASKLGDILDDVSDSLSETELQNSMGRKQLGRSPEQKAHKPVANNEDTSAVEKPTYSAAKQFVEVNSKSKTPVWQLSDSSSLSPLGEPEEVEVSPEVPKQVKDFNSQEAPKANGDEIFKKPDIPTNRKNTSFRPENSEPLTVQGESVEEAARDEPEQDVVTSEHATQGIAEGAQDTPTESVRDKHDTAEIGIKRKAQIIATTPPKRQRVDVSKARAEEASQALSLPSTPAVGGESIPMQTKKSRKSTEKIASPRRSPRLMDRAKQASEAAMQAISEGASAAKDPNRKPHLVSFGINGALNQGVSSTVNPRKDPPSSKHVPEPNKAPKPVRNDVREKKRKGEQLELLDAENRSSKRQSVSPRESAILNGHEEDELPILPDDSSAEAVKTKSTQNRHSVRFPMRLSSQTSRVDKNGSPMASSQEDHFGKLQKRLAAKKNGNESQAPQPPPAESPVTVQPRRLSEVFGPRVVLENKSKARNSSPEETEARYVAHEKTAHGLYQELATKQVVAPEKKLQDPFTEKARKSNGFTERLMNGSSRGNTLEASKPSESTVIEGQRARRVDQHALPSHTRGTPRADLEESARRAQKFRARQKGRVEVEEQPLSTGSTPSEMTMGSSYDSISSQPERMPLDEKQSTAAVWNVALRPHYNSIHDAVHRIADEVLIRLADEEDKMALLVEQYEQGGDKILSKLEQRHENQRVAVVGAVNQKRAEMVSIYSEATEFLRETTEGIKENSTIHFEREWRKKQDAIRDEISAGRKVSEL